MGNSQSTSSKRSTKIGKFKTNPSTSNLNGRSQEDISAYPVEPLSKAYGETWSGASGHAQWTAYPGDHHSQHDNRQLLRNHLYGQAHGSFEDEEATVDPVYNLDNDEGQGRRQEKILEAVKRRLSRSNSRKSLPPLPSALSSTTLLNSFAGSKLSLRLDGEGDPSSSAAEVSQQDRIKDEVPGASKTTTWNYTTTGVVQRGARASPPVQLRRRTMTEHGVATRGRPSSSLRKPPRSDDIRARAHAQSQDYYLEPIRPDSMPLSDFAALDFGQRDRRHTATPPNLDYSPLSFRPGTLRVTNGDANEIWSPPSGQPIPTSPDRASIMAQEYMEELPSRRFSFAQYGNHSPASAGRSARASFESSIFNDEGVASSPSKQANLFRLLGETRPERYGQSREDALRALDDTTSPRSPSDHRKANKVPPSTSRSSQDSVTKKIVKSDSGYGSRVSLHSANEEEEEFPNPRVIARPTSEVQEETRRSRGREARPKTAPTPHPLRSSPMVPSKPPEQSRTIPRRLPSPSPSRSIKKRWRRSLTTLGLREPQVPEEETPRPAPRRLQKNRPRSMPPPKMSHRNDNQDDDMSKMDLPDQVPPVPTNVAASLAKRLRKFPTLEHTYPSLQHTNSKESLRSLSTFAWHGPFEWETHGKDLGSEREGSAPPRARNPINRFSSERRSNTQPPPSENRYITSFGTVTETIGPGPYDQAMRDTGINPRRSAEDVDIHPHQIGGISRSRTMVGMDEESAAALAREKSRDRGRGASRPKSAHDCQANNDGSVKLSRSARPQSMIATAPPIPDLPATTVSKERARRVDRQQKTPPPTSLSSPVPDQTLAAVQLKNDRSSEDSAPHAIHQSWESFGILWRERRKSASAGLKATIGVSQDTVSRGYDDGDGNVVGEVSRNAAGIVSKSRNSRPSASEDAKMKERAREWQKVAEKLSAQDEGRPETKETQTVPSKDGSESQLKRSGASRKRLQKSQSQIQSHKHGQSQSLNFGVALTVDTKAASSYQSSVNNSEERLPRPEESNPARSRRSSPSRTRQSRSRHGSVNNSEERLGRVDEHHSMHSSRRSSPSRTRHSSRNRVSGVPSMQEDKIEASPYSSSEQLARSSLQRGGERSRRSSGASRKSRSSKNFYELDLPVVERPGGGRYEGGLDFSYGPGTGLGGSAGTRDRPASSSRESLSISRDLGLDLTDVPMLVA
ncbi:MAG: hypothetical protein M1838_001563 [Thelocarpon superellum]|nr:MAG: hypothetical protein M1838_001563 [Thelocarpon superellum]